MKFISLGRRPHVVAVVVLMLLLPAVGESAPDVGDAAYPWPACGRVDAYPDADWPAAGVQPGWDEAALERAQTYFSGIDSAAMMVVWRGHPIAAWGAVDEPYLVQSVRKPVMNLIAGQLLDAGVLSLQSTLGELGVQDYDPPLSELNLSATVADVFRSRSGIYHSAHYEVGGWKRLRGALAERALTATGEAASVPGEIWVYNNWDFNAVGEILTRASGESLAALLENRVVAPLGLQDFEVGTHLSYEEDGDLTAMVLDNHSAIPAYLLELSARDLARIGLVNLGCGKWAGQKLVSRDWVLASTTGIPTSQGAPEGMQIPNRGAYGYLWFVEAGDSRSQRVLNLLPPFYYHSGNRGHQLYVMPHLDLVISHEVATAGGSGILGQIRRSLFGSPEVGGFALEKLVAMVVAAHPDAEARGAAEEALARIQAYESSR